MTALYEVSIVIPVVREDAALVELLRQIRAWPRKPGEVIVADGATSEHTRAHCYRNDATWVASVPGRATQLMKGAGAAKGSILWFLHADSTPDPDALDAIIASVDSGALGGCFRFRFAGKRSLVKTLLEWSNRLRCRWGGVPYGEQGLYVSREAFDVCGGFAPMPMFEEVPLIRTLCRQGRFDRLEMPLLISDVPWQREGWLLRTLKRRALALAYGLGISPARLARLTSGRAQ